MTILSIIIIVISICLLIRNEFIFKFINNLNKTCYNVCVNKYNSVEKFMDGVSIWHSIVNISWIKMLFSFKKLTAENWLNETQLKFINNE